MTVSVRVPLAHIRQDDWAQEFCQPDIQRAPLPCSAGHVGAPVISEALESHCMSLAIGTFIGTFRILAPLGKGGMGEVYRARDTRLHRDVALKILPDVFATDQSRMTRFRHEAEVLAALNHPNIGNAPRHLLSARARG